MAIISSPKSYRKIEMLNCGSVNHGQSLVRTRYKYEVLEFDYSNPDLSCDDFKLVQSTQCNNGEMNWPALGDYQYTSCRLATVEEHVEKTFDNINKPYDAATVASYVDKVNNEGISIYDLSVLIVFDQLIGDGVKQSIGKNYARTVVEGRKTYGEAIRHYEDAWPVFRLLRIIN